MASERLQRRIERLLDQIEREGDQQNGRPVLDLAKEALGVAPENVHAKAFLAVAEKCLISTGGPAPSAVTSPAVPEATVASPDESHLSSVANDHYQVHRFLGEGSKKKVYLAQGTTLDQEVAFDLIKTEGLGDTSRTRIQPEARAMGRLGSRPHIVPVFELGQEQDKPYMVTAPPSTRRSTSPKKPAVAWNSPTAEA